MRKAGILFMIAFLGGGCGSTLHGMNEDVHRVGRGVKMIFVSEETEKQKAKPSPEAGKPALSDFFVFDQEGKGTKTRK